jgi:two-component system NtrC family sensor kinase
MQDHGEERSIKADENHQPASTPAVNADFAFGPIAGPILQSLPMGVVAFDANLKIVRANSQAANLIRLGDHIDKSLAEGTDSPVAAGPEWAEKLKSAISTDTTHIFDVTGYTANGKTRLLQLVYVPLKHAKTPASLAGCMLIEDVTERVNTRRQLANAERLATVGKLASKVAHELNDLMDGTLRYINLATRIVEQEKHEKPKEYLVRCRQGLTRMIKIVSELLEFSRGSHIPLEYANVEQIIEDALSTIESKAESSNIRILRDYARGMPPVRSDNLFQVFCNIIKNAFDAMPNGGELHVSTYPAADSTIAAKFRDTGSGFPPEHTEAIFEPFFTTKEQGKGTGLGLAICKDIIEQYHGRITAENAPQGGGIFTVYLPLTDNP